MSTYAIGDVQGCYNELMELLTLINYDSARDRLWFVGDLVNRGPNSLQVLRFIKKIKDVVVVLGNHDLHLITLHYGKSPIKILHNLEELLLAPDAGELIDWLRLKPFLYYDQDLNYMMAHAGIYPLWDKKEAVQYAKEAENLFQTNINAEFLSAMYGNKPDIWDYRLEGMNRWRFIVNSFTRMRFCDMSGRLEFLHTGPVETAPDGFLPWFKMPYRKSINDQIIFGHWASLTGITNVQNVYALDTGCVWGKALSAMRLEDKKRFIVRSHL